jgi:hypothetical protein
VLEQLYEAVRLLDRYLSQFAVFMEDMEHVSLGDSFRRNLCDGRSLGSIPDGLQAVCRSVLSRLTSTLRLSTRNCMKPYACLIDI